MDENHCEDCCCAKSWKALGITEYTGKSIPEHITELRSENERLKKEKLMENKIMFSKPVRVWSDAIQGWRWRISYAFLTENDTYINTGLIISESKESVIEKAKALEQNYLELNNGEL